MNRKLLNIIGVLINTSAFGFNINEMYGRFMLNITQAFELVNVNMILTIIISVLAIVWWRVKIKGQKMQNKLYQLEIEEKKRELEKEK